MNQFDILSLHTEATECYERGDYAGAYAKTEPMKSFAKMAFNLGQLCIKMNRPLDEAIYHQSCALLIDPYLAIAYLQRGVCYNLSGTPKLALQDFLQVNRLMHGQESINYRPLGLEFVITREWVEGSVEACLDWIASRDQHDTGMEVDQPLIQLVEGVFKPNLRVDKPLAPLPPSNLLVCRESVSPYVGFSGAVGMEYEAPITAVTPFNTFPRSAAEGGHGSSTTLDRMHYQNPTFVIPSRHRLATRLLEEGTVLRRAQTLPEKKSAPITTTPVVPSSFFIKRRETTGHPTPINTPPRMLRDPVLLVPAASSLLATPNHDGNDAPKRSLTVPTRTSSLTWYHSSAHRPSSDSISAPNLARIKLISHFARRQSAHHPIHASSYSDSARVMSHGSSMQESVATLSIMLHPAPRLAEFLRMVVHSFPQAHASCPDPDNLIPKLEYRQGQDWKGIGNQQDLDAWMTGVVLPMAWHQLEDQFGRRRRSEETRRSSVASGPGMVELYCDFDQTIESIYALYE